LILSAFPAFFIEPDKIKFHLGSTMRVAALAPELE
jgi:hypothetical protein